MDRDPTVPMSPDAPAVLVTGGARRIGRALVLAFAKRGFDIALHYRSSADTARQVAADVEQLGRRCTLWTCDFLDQRAVSELVPQVAQAMPRLELLVNNASIFERGGLLDTNDEHWSRHLDVNFRAPVLLTRHFARLDSARHIINMLDTRVTTPQSTYAAYTLSKQSLYDFTGLAARELAPHIRVNAIAPGMILPPEGQDESYFNSLLDRVPLQRHGTLDDIVRAIMFLIDSPYLTGECLFVDGGEHLGTLVRQPITQAGA